MAVGFGHFLLESTSRLWALDELAESIDGIIFTQFRSGGVGKARKRYAPFLDILSGDKPLKILREPTRVENLVVPDPGFGHHHRMAGSLRYRRFTRAQVAKAFDPSGPERLYVTHSDLMDKRGGIFGETRIEEILTANGFTIFHPQKHSARVQLAHYRVAKEVVSLDGSALHMAAYALRPDARVGMIMRRHTALLDGLAKQIELFSGAKVFSFDALRADWIDEKVKRVDFRSLGELDFVKLQGQLANANFISASQLREGLNEQEIRNLIDDMDRGKMRRVPVGAKP